MEIQLFWRTGRRTDPTQKSGARLQRLRPEVGRQVQLRRLGRWQRRTVARARLRQLQHRQDWHRKKVDPMPHRRRRRRWTLIRWGRGNQNVRLVQLDHEVLSSLTVNLCVEVRELIPINHYSHNGTDRLVVSSTLFVCKRPYLHAALEAYLAVATYLWPWSIS